MKSDSRIDVMGGVDRINLRLAGHIFAAIDGACAVRPGNVSRNTWIAEAIAEKLTRERSTPAAHEGRRRAHG